ncbi:Protein transport protein SEC31 [Hondaea fermentalgiana]|uniref:Protein transport protein SEC31 n=1 Tax=Hondaea fermentalgiana TaxID=2315210 RepID=A0A2R5G0I5_9STRA|nr:Protein transport protein SEC31 [Hondaea fermentalgiana]|eukprot:GBG24510.1 Protein transport protein SEC31 [Hondaea fermentalgiana]
MSVVQEIKDKGAVLAWCPIKAKSTYIALGAKDGANEKTFDDYGGELDIYNVGLNGESEPKFVGKAETSTRFNCIAWGAKGPSGMGVIAGGMQNGDINIWNPAKLGDPLAVVKKHKAKVNSLQFHPCAGTEHLLATGASDNEVYIVDLNKPEQPNVHSPAGAGSQKHSAEVRSVAWNLEVQHVLATAALDAACTVWSLKAKKPWAEIRDPNGCGISAIAWSPVRGLHHLLTASNDDRDPVLRLWDVRSSTTQPLAEYRGHTAGIFSLSWCPDDSSYFMSCGKDNRTLFWDLYSGKPVAEVHGDGSKHTSDAHAIGNGGAGGGIPSGLGAPPSSFGGAMPGAPGGFGAPASGGDVFGGMGGIANSNKGRRYQVTFSPHNRTIFASCSFDRKVQILSINGACGGVEEAARATSSQPPVKMRAPAWTRRKCGAVFGFGGRIVNFGSAAPLHPSTVRVSKITDEPQVVQDCVTWEEQFGAALNMDMQAHQQTGSTAFAHMSELCQARAAAAASGADREAWSFMKILFEPSARDKILEQLGFDMDAINQLVASLDHRAAEAAAAAEPEASGVQDPAAPPYDDPNQYQAPQQSPAQAQQQGGFSQVQQQMEQLRLQGLNQGAMMNGLGSDAAAGSGADVFDDFTHQDEKANGDGHDAFAVNGDAALNGGGAETPSGQDAAAAPQESEPAEADAAAASSPVASPRMEPVKPQRRLEDVSLEDVEVKDSSVDDVISKALLVGNFGVAVSCCMENNRFADALLLSSCGGPELWNETLASYLERFYEKKPYIPVLSAVIQQDLDAYVRRSDVSGDNWKEVLAIVSQYGKSDDVPALCEILAGKLETERNDEDATIAACFCYICAKNVEKTVNIFLKQGVATLGSSPSALDRVKLSQSIVEKTQVYMQALEDPTSMMAIPNVMAHYIDYATFLASQGLLEYAAKYIASVDATRLQPTASYDEHGNLVDTGASGMESAHNEQASRALMLMDRLYGAHPQPEYGLSQYISGPVAAFEVKQFGVAPSNTPYVPEAESQHVPEQQQQQQQQQPMQQQQSMHMNGGYHQQQQPQPSFGASQMQQQPQQPQQPQYNQPQPSAFSAPQPQYGQPSPMMQPQQPQMPAPQQQPQQQQQQYGQPSPMMQPQSSARQMNQGLQMHMNENDGFGSTAGNPAAGQKYGNLTGQSASGYDSMGPGQQQQQQQQQQGIFNPNAAQAKPAQSEPAPQPVQRSMPPQMAPVMQMLDQHLQTLGARMVSTMDKRKFSDAEKGANALKEKLMTGAVSEDLFAEITQLIQALASNDYTSANAVLQVLTARTHVWAEHKDWIRGMRPLALLSRR